MKATTSKSGLSTSTASGELSHRQVLIVISGLLLGMLLAGLDQTIVATASRTIGDDLNDLSQLAWLTTAFLTTSTITTLLYGKLSDIFGRKRLYLLAIVIFLVGSALCGLATSIPMLAAFRALQGVGAGGLMSLAFAITGDVIAPRQRARYQGYFAGTLALSSVLGPLIGGLFSSLPTLGGIAGWRWVFWVNIPIGIAALAIIARNLNIDQTLRGRRIDWRGAVFLTIGLVPLLLVGQEGSSWGWLSTGAWTSYIVGAAGVVIFIITEIRMHTDALLPMHLFRGSSFSIPSAITFVLGVVQLGGIAVIPLYLQIVKGATPTEAGLLILPMVLGISGGAILAGNFTARTGKYKILPIIGTGALIVAFVGLSTVGVDTSLWLADLWMLLIGAGLGFSTNTLILALQNTVDPSQMGVATATGTFFRNIGGTVGVAVLLSILFNKAGTAIQSGYAHAERTATFAKATAAHPEQLNTLKHGLSAGLSDTAFLGKISPVFARPFLQGFAQAMDLVSIVVAGVCVVAFVLALFLKELPLRTLSGRATAQQNEQLKGATNSNTERATSTAIQIDNQKNTITGRAQS